MGFNSYGVSMTTLEEVYLADCNKPWGLLIKRLLLLQVFLKLGEEAELAEQAELAEKAEELATKTAKKSKNLETK